MTEAQINDLVEKFSNKTLLASEWTHHAHLVVAFWHNWHYEFEEALEMVKHKIKVYNEAVGTPNTDDSGYHETLTIFWMMLTQNDILANTSSSLEHAYAHFIAGPNADKELPLSYYTKEVLFSVKARKEWVSGDIKEITLL